MSHPEAADQFDNSLPPDPDRLHPNELEALGELTEKDYAQISEEIDADLDSWRYAEQHRPSSGTVAVVVTNLLDPVPLTQALQLRGVSGQVVPTSMGCLVWRKIADNQIDEFQALLGEEAAAPAEAEEMAREISKITPYGVVLMVSNVRKHQLELTDLQSDFPWAEQYMQQLSADLDAQMQALAAGELEELGESKTAAAPSEEKIAENLADDDISAGQVVGQIMARVYYDGQFDHQMPAGLMVNCADEILEDLLLGRTTPDDYDLNSRNNTFFQRLTEMKRRYLGE